MKLLKSFYYAFNGIKICFASEINFKIHLAAAITAVALGFVLNISLFEWVAIIFCIALVASIEMINTAIEKLCNVVYEGINPKIKMVKDIAAGAVLLTAIGSLIIGCIIFVPKIIDLLKHF